MSRKSEDPHQKPGVLLVDDNEHFIRIFTWRYEEWLDVTSSSNCPEALEMLRGGAFDAAVIDYSMQEMSGLDLLRAIRKEHPDLPVILLSGRGDAGIVREAFECGADNYVVKEMMGINRSRALIDSIESAIEARNRKKEMENL